MKKIVRWTLGAITFRYYIRHFIIGCLFFALSWRALYGFGTTLPLSLMTCLSINTVFFAYSKFALTSFLEFLNGGSVRQGGFLGRAFYSWFCFCSTVFVAPLGLIYLFWLSWKQDAATKQLDTA